MSASKSCRNDAGETGYRVYAGGGMGRTPYVGHVVGDFVAKTDILAFLEAVMRVYNQSGRRDNIYKARIKILVNALGPEEMRRQVEREFAEIRAAGTLEVPAEERAASQRYFAPPAFEALDEMSPEFEAARAPCESGVPRLDRNQSRGASRARLCHRHDFAQAHRGRAGRCERMNSSTRWPI